jgi:shikimate dehydrogenase
VDIVIDATSVGLYPDVDDMVPIDLATLRPGLVVADVVPNPPRTRLLTEAGARGCTTLDGLGMLANQGAVAVRLWTGIDPDRSVMRAALEDALGIAAA